MTYEEQHESEVSNPTVLRITLLRITHALLHAIRFEDIAPFILVRKDREGVGMTRDVLYHHLSIRSNLATSPSNFSVADLQSHTNMAPTSK